MDLQRSLAFGFFPHEVPLSFSSQSFANATPGLTPLKPGGSTSPVRFSLARAGGVRRATEIPNPLAQWATAELCSSNWRKLQSITAKSPLSLSRPVRKRAGRALTYICEPSRKPEVAISRMPGGTVTLQTDISQFYPSIYTHAVDWAIRGKTTAKRARRVKTLGTELDARLRESRSGQTVGLSIGPDTSWLVSEVLLARVDEALCREHQSLSRRAFRFVDDISTPHLRARHMMSFRPTNGSSRTMNSFLIRPR
jgi:hypothetical protein